MILGIGATIFGALLLGSASILAVNGLREDLTASVQGYRQLRQLFDVGLLVSRARDALAQNPPSPVQAKAGLASALNELDRRSAANEVDGPPANWIDESARADCRRSIERAIDELNTGQSNPPPALNQTFSRLSKIAGDLRRSIADAQNTADHRLHVAQQTILTVDSVLIALALLLGVVQYRRVVYPIWQLARGVRAFTAGKLDERIELSADREFVALANDFNTMAVELASLYRDLEQKVADKSKLLARSEQLAGVGFLAASVAHEINNPLGIIAAYGERALKRLGDHPETAPAREALQVMCEEAFRCKQITDRLLSLARPGPEQRAKVSLAKIAGMVVGLLNGLGSGGGRQVSLQVQPDADFHLLANEGEMKQLLLNLLTNAMDAVDEKTGRVLVQLVRGDEELQMLVIDNGVGLSKESLESVFEPFESHKTGKARGTGLGLTIAQSIVAEHGGSIQAFSDGLGKGCKFTVLLPAWKDPAE
jgi:signal transduction histidine kinase